MTLTRIVFGSLGLALAAFILWAMTADARPFPQIVESLVSAPWAAVTLADLYLGFAISAAIVILTERRLWVGLFWALPIFVLGNVWTALWIVIRLPALAVRLRV